MKVIFLDIDGVLNAHEKLASGYCGIREPFVGRFNRILDAVTDARLVISSAWRYITFQGHMTTKGFEYLLLVHGVKAHERVIGTTAPDGPIEQEPDRMVAETWRLAGLKWRRAQIADYLAAAPHIARYVVLDDLPLGMPNLIQTDGAIGLTDADANRAIAALKG